MTTHIIDFQLQPIIEALKRKDAFAVQKELIKFLEIIINKYPIKPRKSNKESFEDCIRLKYLLFEIDDDIPYKISLSNILDSTYQYNRTLLSCFNKPDFINFLLIEIMNFVYYDEPYYFSQKELLNELQEYKDGKTPNLFRVEKEYHALSLIRNKYLRNKDESLTPENCEEKGYRYIVDEIYDPEAPIEARKNIEELLDKGYKLGVPATRTADYIFSGLYAPLKGNVLFENLDYKSLYKSKKTVVLLDRYKKLLNISEYHDHLTLHQYILIYCEIIKAFFERKISDLTLKDISIGYCDLLLNNKSRAGQKLFDMASDAAEIDWYLRNSPDSISFIINGLKEYYFKYTGKQIAREDIN